jgi:hypothetical protein
MSKKQKHLEDLKTWKELEDFAEGHGIPYDRTSGGHRIHKNEKGSMPFSTHEKEPSKHLRSQVIKQIKKLMIISGVIVIFIYYFL